MLPTTVVVDPVQNPHAWTLPWDPDHLPGPRFDDVVRLAGQVPPPAGHTITTVGGEPLGLADLHDRLGDALQAGLRVVLGSRVPTLHDDGPLRPFSAHDVRFRVPVPHHDPAGLSTLTGVDGATLHEQLVQALRNLEAFGFPIDLVLPVGAANVAALPDTVAWLIDTFSPRGVHLEVVAGRHADDPAWDHAAPWTDLHAALHDLEARALRPHPRLHVTGIPALALPLDALEEVDLRVEAPPDDPWSVPEGYPFDDATPPNRDVLDARRVWLASRPKDRRSHRGDPRDRLLDAVSTVLVRPGHDVFATVERLGPSSRPLTRWGAYGVNVYGRFDDPTLAQRFTTLARALYAQVEAEPPDSLARLRAIAHVLRRSMKPKHDGEAVKVREEGD